MRYLIIMIMLLFGQSALANHHEEKIIIERADIGSEIFNLGKEVYQANCATCHQPNLSGQVGWKDKLDNDGHRLAPPMNGTGHTWHHDDKTLFYITKYGLAKLVPKYEGKMMGFGDQLNDQEIKSVLAYIKSFWTDDKYQYQMKLN
ncbi:cytochrome c [Pelagibacteraceae bacterium]|nr:cytochrome c [Pelagibacteraceae bacterium]